MATVCSFIAANNRKAHPQKQNRHMKATFYMSVEHCVSLCLPFCRTTQFRRRRHSLTLLSMNDCGSFCHANRSFQFVNSYETLTMVDHLLKGTPDGIINRVQFRAIQWPHVWLNEQYELHVLTLPKTRCVTTAIIR